MQTKQNDIFDYIKEHDQAIAYITRSYIGSWSISLIKQGNITSRSINSYSQLSDQDLETIKTLGFKTFDFVHCEDFRSLMHTMEQTSKDLCY